MTSADETPAETEPQPTPDDAPVVGQDVDPEPPTLRDGTEWPDPTAGGGKQS